MKMMSARKMNMKPGQPKSEGFFPEEARCKEMARPGEIRAMPYPDTEEAIFGDQESMVKSTSRNEPKVGFRH